VTTRLPRISIVTPSFNQARFLEECIDSVLSQGYPDVEYIVMDGGSTDGSVEIIKKYQRHLAYWQSCPDGGHYAAVAAGFERTTGNVMAWLNSDDKYLPLAFLKTGFVFANYPAIQWITGRPLRWSAEGHAEDICADAVAFSRERVVVRGEFQTPWICQEATFWRRELWERAGGGPRADIRLAADFELWVRFFRHAQLQFVDALLGGNRRHDQQRSVLFLNEYLHEARTVLEKERTQPQPSSLPPPQTLRLDARDVKDLLRDAGIGKPMILAEEVMSDLVDEIIRLTVDRALQLDANERVVATLLESEADRAARLNEIHALGMRLAEVDADRTARLEAIEWLQAKLEESEADRAARLLAIEELSQRLAEANARLSRNF
jgi:hypothetical protein